MCDIDRDDHESFTVWQERDVRAARKAHRCQTCGATIAVGQPYRRHFSVSDGAATDEAQCAACRDVGAEFGKAHNFYVAPSYLPTMLSDCVGDDEPGADRWREALAQIRARQRAAA